MSNPTWWQAWHGEAFPVSTGGGSTAMSTGVVSTITAISTRIDALCVEVSTKAAGTHTHATNDVSSLASTLAGLAAQISTKAAGSHTHPTAEIAGLDSALSTKASLDAGIVPSAQLGSSTADGSVFLRGDRVWAAPTAAAAGVIPSTWVIASTHTLTGSTTMQSAAGLSFAVSSRAIYRFEFMLGWQTISSATGIALGVNGPASPTLVTFESGVSSGFGPTVTRAGRAFGVQRVASPGSSAANLDEFGYLGGLLRTGANAGTLQLQFASEVAGSTVRISAGSLGLLFGPFANV